VYTLAAGPTVLAGTATQSIYYAPNISGAAAGANTVTVTFSGGATFPDVRIAEYGGLNLATPLDVAVGASGSSALGSSGAMTTTNAADLLVGANYTLGVTSGPGAGYTARVITNPDGDILEDQVVAAIGSYSATAPFTGSTGWIMQLVAFRGAGSGSLAVMSGPASAAVAQSVGVTRPKSNTTAQSDYDGDGKADIVVYQPNGVWNILQSHSGFTTSMEIAWGTAGDVPVPGDYDGDGKTDLAVFHPATGQWQILLSSTNYTTSLTLTWGTSTDIPVPGDYDGDGKTDLAYYRPSTGQWQILTSSSNYTSPLAGVWGTSTDIPVPGDYDGDGKTDLATFSPATGQWRILFSSANYTTGMTVNWGIRGDIPVPGDYDGDRKTDLAVFRPSTGTWYFLYSKMNFTTSMAVPWGNRGDVPVVGDYDGDGKADLALFTPSGWSILLSNANYTTSLSLPWGSPSDRPLPIRP
jgi:hypothetical protein